MRRRRPSSRFIQQHFAGLRKSRRNTICALVAGLMSAGRLGVAAIARGMEPATTMRKP